MAETSSAAASTPQPLVDTPARGLDDYSSSETDRDSIELRHRRTDPVEDHHIQRHSEPFGHHHKSRIRPHRHRQEGVPSSDEADGEEEEDEENNRDFIEETERFVPGNDPFEMATWSGKASIKGSSETVRMMLLTFVTIGIAFTWGIEMTYCTPYLLALGLTKSKTSLVWIAGPLSGLIVQPLVGAISDESKSRWGRRRPLIVIGALIVSTSLLVLGFTKELVGMFIPDGEAAKTVTIVTAVFSIYAVDFAINAVMSCARSLVADTLPISKQQTGAAWSSRMGAIGHMIGYGMGAIDLVSLFGTTLGDTQFKQLAVVASFGMLVCSGITCWAVTERILVEVSHDPKHGSDPFKPVRRIWSTLQHLPPRVRAICWAQFWSWIGWFPFLFYSTTWVGETYFRYDVPEDQQGSTDALGDIGRIGSTSLVIYSSVTFIGAWLLPIFVKSPEDEGYTHRPPQSIAKYAEVFNKYKPDLLTAWIYGHLVFAGAMFFAPFATSFRFATMLVAICGLPWALAMWAPTAFLGIEVNKLSGGDSGSTTSYRRLSNSEIEMGVLSPGNGTNRSNSPAGGEEEAHSSGELSGIYFGILNIYTTLPQFVSTFISTVVFAILEPGKSPELATDAHPDEHHSTDGPNAIAVCLFIGACCAVVASFSTRKLKNM